MKHRLTRRSALPLLGGLAVAAVEPAVATAGDPIFFLINKHKVAHARFEAAAKVDDTIAGIGPAALAAYNAAADVVEALVRTEPTSLAGCIALLDYIRACEHGPDGIEHDLYDQWPAGAERELRHSLRAALARLAARS
jgi:hypothetical protein